MNNDLISRSELKKVLEPIAKQLYDSLYGDGICRALKEINNAPAVDVKGEKIIRCIDCKYYHPFKHWCDCHGDWAGGENGFCSLAKMKGGAEE